MSELLINPFRFEVVCGPGTSVFSDTLNNDTLAGDFSFRQIIPLTGGGNSIRVRVEYTSVSCTVDNASVGQRSGATANTTATPVEIFFPSASNGFTGSGLGTEWSDWQDLGFTVTSSDELIIVFDLDATGNYRRVQTGGPGHYFKAATDSYDQQNVTDFTLNATHTLFSIDVELRTCS